MKTKISKISILLMVFAFTSCSMFKKSTTDAEQIPKDLISYLREFENAVATQNTDKVLQLMDADYVKEQHDNFLNGNTWQFLNEFFCGIVQETNDFYCINFFEIERIERRNIVEHNGSYSVTYWIYDKKDIIKTSWSISVRETEGQTVYGLFGAVG